ncbi:hypothetical protein [Neolewinella litorea]|uniref:Uncharacterized protein n=1 Tax=Neolewinella litorea TaxID=2562452 RepID=A0A4S4NKA5_9BACT|nr:hypothetical protein [Neolewinella litorea]THH39375.1 hypothetical protein E4021_11520 [Neolewinella litorea]
MINILLWMGIHVFVPAGGVLAYLIMLKRMKKEHTSCPPVRSLLLVFASYGGVLLVLLTALFWKWSALASFGAAYLVLGAPLIMGAVAYMQFPTRVLSKYHSLVYRLALIYAIAIPVVVLALRAFNLW